MKWNELIKDEAWVVEELLLPSEAKYFKERAIKLGILNKKSAGDVRHRDSLTIAFKDTKMADVLFERIKTYIPQEVVVDENCDRLGLSYSKNELIGTWKPYKLNDMWRIVCYDGKGHFGPHRDGCYKIDDHHRSLITINGFLTDRPGGFGGATRFVRDDINVELSENGIFTTAEVDVLHKVEADKAGKASVFFHDLMHDGEPLKAGSPPKWLFRTEVMYERDPETAPKLSEDQIKARKYLDEAEDAEKNGDIIGATKLYKMAYRLDSSLDGNPS